MKNIFYKATVMWAQIDANQHMRHSAYADYAAQARMGLLDSLGLPAPV
ncbi:MAG: thioesterase, partial [Bacteroidales bacterium]|nr:thioesterase [Bacteroidales bacterium]